MCPSGRHQGKQEVSAIRLLRKITCTVYGVRSVVYGGACSAAESCSRRGCNLIVLVDAYAGAHVVQLLAIQVWSVVLEDLYIAIGLSCRW